MATFRLTDENYARAIRILAVLYAKNWHEMYINYMANTKACAEWLIPDYETRGFTSTCTELPIYYGSYELQQLSRHWKLDCGGVLAALSWAREEIARHDPSNPQATLPF